MKQKLKPARVTLIASVILSAVYLITSAMVVVLQPYLRGAIYGAIIVQNVYPVPDLHFMVLKAVIHIVPAMLLISALDRNDQKPPVERLQSVSFILLIYFSFIQPVVSILANYALTYVRSRNVNVEALQGYAILTQFLSFPNLLYGMATCLFLVSLAMIWYFCYLEKKHRMLADMPGSNDN